MSPVFVPDKFVADIEPVNTAPANLAYVVEAFKIERNVLDAYVNVGNVVDAYA